VVVLEALVPCQGLGSPATMKELYPMSHKQSLNPMMKILKDFNTSVNILIIILKVF